MERGGMGLDPDMPAVKESKDPKEPRHCFKARRTAPRRDPRLHDYECAQTRRAIGEKMAGDPRGFACIRGSVSPSEILSRIAAAKRAVLAHTDLLHREFGRAESKWKSDGTRVTAVDVAISEAIFRDLAAQFPGDQFFSEELAETDAPIPVTARFSWVLDPIDGTNNFALGLVHCAISLALCEHGEPVYGVVYDLSRRSLLHGGPGFGVWDGERSTRVNTAPASRESLLGFHSPFDKALVPLTAGLLANFKVRGLGSATLHLAYVAAGFLDGCVDFNVKIWDLAAAIPLVRAAGGEVHFLNGEQLPMRTFNLKMAKIVYVAGSPVMCARLRTLMAR